MTEGTLPDPNLRIGVPTPLDLLDLLDALRNLYHLETRQELLEALSGLLALHGEHHVSVWRVQPEHLILVRSLQEDLAPDATIPYTGIVGHCASHMQSVYVTDTGADSRYLSMDAVDYEAELALPLFERDSVVAVLNVERQTPFEPRELRALECFAVVMGEHLTERSERSEARIVAALGLALAQEKREEAIARRVLDVLFDHLPLRGGVIIHSASRARILASSGSGTSWRDVPAGAGIRAIPLGTAAPPRNTLVLEAADPRFWTRGDDAITRSAAQCTALALEPARDRAILEELLELQQQVVSSDTDLLYDRILEVAVRLVPGAEAGSLQVRREGEQPFQFRSAFGHSLAQLEEVRFSEARVRAWHGGTLGEWREGIPRILTRETTDFQALGTMETGAGAPVENRLDLVQAVLCLPVTLKGDVLAVLNLENFTRADAFGEDSVRAARLFAPPVAALLQNRSFQDQVIRAAHTDPITGLPNRRAFDEALRKEIARARRSGDVFTVFMMDLRNFKHINDTLGHEAGDKVLRDVAAALTGAQRDMDTLARWGGDEFAAILPGAAHAEAKRVKVRFQHAVSRLRGHDSPLRINIGMSAFPSEAESAQDLLVMADQRMYREKRRTPPHGPEGGHA